MKFEEAYESPRPSQGPEFPVKNIGAFFLKLVLADLMTGLLLGFLV